jgi:hypothetical protein
VARHYLGGGPAGELAQVWDQLSEAAQRNIISQIRDGLAVARDTAADSIADLTHEPYGSPGKPMRHYHLHHLAADRTHAHIHQHENDALHIGHPHGADGGEDEDVSPDARVARRRIVNSAPRRAPQTLEQAGRVDDAFARLAWLGNHLGRR